PSSAHQRIASSIPFGKKSRINAKALGKKTTSDIQMTSSSAKYFSGVGMITLSPRTRAVVSTCRNKCHVVRQYHEQTNSSEHQEQDIIAERTCLHFTKRSAGAVSYIADKVNQPVDNVVVEAAIPSTHVHGQPGYTMNDSVDYRKIEPLESVRYNQGRPYQ